jgi:hypothetical protein
MVPPDGTECQRCATDRLTPQKRIPMRSAGWPTEAARTSVVPALPENV